MKFYLSRNNQHKTVIHPRVVSKVINTTSDFIRTKYIPSEPDWSGYPESTVIKIIVDFYKEETEFCRDHSVVIKEDFSEWISDKTYFLSLMKLNNVEISDVEKYLILI